ncbi:hypothetical protein [Nocardiopsis nanhaiensis]
MIDQLRRRLALARVEPGDRRELAPFRWWQLPGRALFHLDRASSGLPYQYSVDVRHWSNQAAGTVQVQLFREGRQSAVAKLPATFAVEQGVIEVAMSSVGMKRCQYVTDDGVAHQLRADPRSAEGLRARFESRHPTASRWVGFASVLVLLISIALLLLQIAEPLSAIPFIEERIGKFEAPFTLPIWLNTGLTILAAAGATERALRLRYRWWLDAIGN